jgi:acylphosphatase
VSERRVKLTIEGRVQGVFFRESARRRAEELKLKGYVKNLPDGRVESVAQGSLSDVEKFIAWCRRGPPLASVRGIQVEDEQVSSSDSASLSVDSGLVLLL